MKRWILILCAVLVLCASCGKKEAPTVVPEQAAKQLEQGQKFLKEGKYEEAIQAFNQAVNFGEVGVDAYLGLYEAYQALEDLESAVYALEQGYEATNDEGLKGLYEEQLLELAQWYIEEDNYDGAAESYQKLIRLDQTNTEYYKSLYDVYMVTEEYELSVKALEDGYRATGDEDLKEAWFAELWSQGQMFLENEDFERAITYMETLQKNGSTDAEVSICLAEAYAGLEEYERALEILEQAPDQEDGKVKRAIGIQKIRLGERNYDEGNVDAAIAYLKEALEIAPDEIEAYTILTTIYVEQERLEDARKIVESGVARFAKADSSAEQELLDNFLNAAVDFYTTQDDLEACARFLEKVAVIRPDDEDFKDTLAGIRSMIADEAYAKAEELLEKGDVNGASAQFKRAFALAPENFEAGIYTTDAGSYCLNNDGSFLTGWYQIDGSEKFYFNPGAGSTHGLAVTGWHEIDGSFYYFDEGGSMLVDDIAPDGRYVGPDGKLMEGGAPQEEESEEETEEETEESEEETEENSEAETTPPRQETPDETKTPDHTGKQESSGHTSAAEWTGKDTLTLNVSVLRRIRNSGVGETVKSSEIFEVSGKSLSLNDIYTSLKKYGMTVSWISEEEPYHISMGDLSMWILPGDKWKGGAVVVKDAAEYKKSLFSKALPEEFDVVVEFDNAQKTAGRVDLDKMEEINEK